MIELNIRKRGHLNEILKLYEISSNDFKILKSHELNIKDKEKVEDLKKDISNLINKIGSDKLVNLIISSSRIILSNKEENNYKYKANKDLFTTLFRAFRFIRETDETLLTKLYPKILQKHYSDFLDNECENASEEQLEKIKGYLVSNTYMAISDPNSKKINIEKIKSEVRSLFPELFIKQTKIRNRN